MIGEILTMLLVEILLVGGLSLVTVLGMLLHRTLEHNRHRGEWDADARLAPVIHLTYRRANNPAPASARPWAHG